MEAVFYDPTRGSTRATPAPVDERRVHAAAVRAAAERAARHVRAGRGAARRRGARAGARGAARPARQARAQRLGRSQSRTGIVDVAGRVRERRRAALPRGGLQMAERTLTGETGALRGAAPAGQRRPPDRGSRARLRARDRRRAPAGGARRLGHVPRREADEARARSRSLLARRVRRQRRAGARRDAGGRRPEHSSSIALTADGATLFVVNPDADSVSVLDPHGARARRRDPARGAHPRVDRRRRVHAGRDAARARAVARRRDALRHRPALRHAVRDRCRVAARSRSVAVGSEPVGVVVSRRRRDGVRRVLAGRRRRRGRRATDSTVVARVRGRGEPWALAWSPADGALLVTHLLGPGVTAIDPAALARARARG